MTRVQQRANLHEKAVQAVAKGEVAPTPKKTRKAAQKTPAVRHIKVHPDVWKRAKELVFTGRYNTIEVISEKEVIVR